MAIDLPDEVVSRILRKGLSPEVSMKLLQDYSDIRAKALDRDRKIARIRKTAAEEIKKLEGEILCGHEVTKYHGDPSGGSDSHEECLICGEIVQDKPYRRS
jgi:hypothetical protein